jgi:iron(III) transport system substrate-binding protein
MEPATVTLSTLSVLAKAPHPNAAKLLMDFIISREGQEVFAKADYIPAHPDVPATVPTLKPAEGKFRAHFFTPEETEEKMPKWNLVFSEFFR